MWKLYKLLNIKERKDERVYLIDEITEIVKSSSQEGFLESLYLMFSKEKIQELHPAELILYFVRGVKRNNLFLFSTFIRGLTHDATKQ
jgi:hypothetical protein